MSKVEFKYTILYVQDVTKSIDFYEKSFGFVRIFITPENDYGELNTGNTTFAFASFDLANTDLENGFAEVHQGHKPFGIELAFTSNDVDQTMHTAILNGAVEYQKPKLKPWGQKVGYLLDPNGFLLEICTPIKN
jgi:lactoylglutathione lyase